MIIEISDPALIQRIQRIARQQNRQPVEIIAEAVRMAENHLYPHTGPQALWRSAPHSLPIL